MKKQRTKIMKNGTSGRTGVSKSKSLLDGTECWMSYGNEDGKRVHLGTSHSFEDACKVRAEWEIQNGYIFEDAEMTKSDKSLLLGIAIGDGHLKKITQNTSCLMISHCDKQKDLLTFKKSISDRILKCSSPELKTFISKTSGKRMWSWNKTDRYFHILRNALYRDGHKHLSKAILSRITDEALAIWWMDDASVRFRNGRLSEAWLWTYCSKQESEFLVQFFSKKYDVIPKIAPRQSKVEEGKWYYSLRFNKGDLSILIPRIKPFSCEAMAYKFPNL